MSWAVVYMGEHYVVDCLAGWLYAGVAFGVVWGAQKLRLHARSLGRHGAGNRTAVAVAAIPIAVSRATPHERRRARHAR
jgi:hypothetical protein